jgi:hypothetical protein
MRALNACPFRGQRFNLAFSPPGNHMNPERLQPSPEPFGEWLRIVISLEISYKLSEAADTPRRHGSSTGTRLRQLI